jgi:hypothetical protein
MAAGQRTPPDLEEKILADYLLRLNYAETARRFDLPARTVVNVVKRLANDELADLRLSIRADLVEKAWSKVDKLIDVVTPENLGTPRSSRGLEAARAAGELARVAHLLEPPEREAEPGPTVINLCTCLSPSTEEDHREGKHSDSAVPDCAECQALTAAGSGPSGVS